MCPSATAIAGLKRMLRLEVVDVSRLDLDVDQILANSTVTHSGLIVVLELNGSFVVRFIAICGV